MKLMKRAEALPDKQITIRNQAGEDVIFPEYSVNAIELENKFRLVRVHLEGSDNCVKFPDKSSGEFHDLKQDVIYTIWGHKWDENQKFKPALPPVDESSTKLKQTAANASFRKDPKQFYATNKAQSSLELFYKADLEGKQKVLVKNKTGKQRYFPVDEVTARLIEEEFHVVRAHLEGSDHSAHFPNKNTGIYDKLIPSVIYIVYGHPYNKWAVWSTQATNQERRLSSQSLTETSTKENLLLPNEVPLENENGARTSGLPKVPSLDKEQIQNYRESWLKVTKKQSSNAFVQM